MKKIKFYTAALLITCSVICGHSQEGLSPAEKEGTQFFKQGQTESAIASFKKALSEQPKSLYSVNALANLYLMSQQYQEAYAMADQGIKMSAATPNFIVAKAKAAMRIGKAQESVDLIDNYLGSHSPDFMMLFVKGSAYNVLGDRQQALNYFSQSITANPNFPDAYLSRGKNLDDIGRYTQAARDLDMYISMREDDPEAFYQRSLIYYHTDNFTSALSDANKAISLSPKYAQALTFRGEVYRALQQPEKAMADFMATMALDPGYAVAYYQAAGLSMDRKEYAKTQTYIAKAIQLVPNAAAYYWIQSRAFLYENKNNDALLAANKAMELDAKSPDSYICQSSALFNLDRYDDAIASVSKGINRNETYYLLYTLRASMYRDKGKTVLADADDTKAKQLAANIK